jgi:hypothetical protein
MAVSLYREVLPRLEPQGPPERQRNKGDFFMRAFWAIWLAASIAGLTFLPMTTRGHGIGRRPPPGPVRLSAFAPRPGVIAFKATTDPFTAHDPARDAIFWYDVTINDYNYVDKNPSNPPNPGSHFNDRSLWSHSFKDRLHRRHVKKSTNAVVDLPETEVQLPPGDYRVVVTLYEMQYHDRGAGYGARFEAESLIVHLR